MVGGAGKALTDKQWRYECILAHKGSISTLIQETGYKLLTHWYNTPDKLHRWNPQTPPTCWRCQTERGTLLHIWWECRLIAPFWDKITHLIRKITETELSLDAACCLLHVNQLTLQTYKHSLTKHLINAARSLVPIHWRSTKIPTMIDWLKKVGAVWEMEDTVAQEHSRVEAFQTTWRPWIIFRYSQEYDDIMQTT